jgi:Transposase IS66 family
VGGLLTLTIAESYGTWLPFSFAQVPLAPKYDSHLFEGWPLIWLAGWEVLAPFYITQNMHVTCTPTLTHYQVDPSRGQRALEAIGILPNFAGISVHDGWGSYFLYDCEHAACIVHLLRYLVFLEEQGVPWAADLKILLLDMKEATEQARQ